MRSVLFSKFFEIQFKLGNNTNFGIKVDCQKQNRRNYFTQCGKYVYICNRKYKLKNKMDTATLQSKPFTPFQIEMLELVAKVTSESEMRDIRRMLGQYFAKRAEDAIDKLWDEGVINDGVIEEWKNEHMRTPYKQ